VLRKKETTHAKEEKEKNIRKKNVPRASLEGRFLFSLARNCTVTVMPDLYASEEKEKNIRKKMSHVLR
jgi:hypothetical protein